MRCCSSITIWDRVLTMPRYLQPCLADMHTLLLSSHDHLLVCIPLCFKEQNQSLNAVCQNPSPLRVSPLESSNMCNVWMEEERRSCFSLQQAVNWCPDRCLAMVLQMFPRASLNCSSFQSQLSWPGSSSSSWMLSATSALWQNLCFLFLILILFLWKAE